jgi:chaperonin GroEL
MEYNLPSEIVKEINFGEKAQNKIVAGVEKLAKAVKSTLGASGKCVIYEDARGKPVITKDGVTVAESVVLYDPVENIGATLIKEAAKNTVTEAGDGTTTATILAEALLKHVYACKTEDTSIRNIKDGLNSGLQKINDYLKSISVDVKGDMLKDVSSISCNNDTILGDIIAQAYEKAGKDSVVLMEGSGSDETYVKVVDGVQLEESTLTSTHFITNQDKQYCELENPLILIVASEIPNVRKIQNILEFVIKNKRELLIIASVKQQVKSAIMVNKVKGNIKANIVDPPGFGPTTRSTLEDLAFLTGATVVDENLGDDLDLISLDMLGEVERAVTDNKGTVLTIKNAKETSEYKDRVKEVKKLIKAEKNGFLKKQQEKRLAILLGSVAIVKVGANSKVELKEKKDRVEDAIFATKAALKEGIVPGGGIALLNAAQKIKPSNIGEEIILKAIQEPCKVILDNAGLPTTHANAKEGTGVNVITGRYVNMVKEGIIDPVLVTKAALKNAVSVASTIISADCILSNVRVDESN